MSDIIYTPPVSSGGGVNPTSTYMPVNIGGTFVDSIIQCIPNTFAQSMRAGSGFGFGTNVIGSSCDSWLGDWNNQIDGIFLQVKNDTISSRIFTANRGFYLDYVINTYIFGDWASNYNATQLVIDDQNAIIYTKNNLVVDGLNINFPGSTYQFGDIPNNSYINFSGNNQYLQFLFNSNQIAIFDWLNNFIEMGNASTLLKLDWSGNRLSLLGDYQNNTLGTFLEIENSAGYVKFKYNSADNGLYLRYSTGQYYFGDFDGILSNTFIIMDATNKTMELSTDTLLFSGGPLQSNTAGGSSGEHLVITLNGTQYKIQLLNP